MWHDGKRYQTAIWRPYVALLLVFLAAGVVYYVKTGNPAVLAAGLFVVVGIILSWAFQACVLRLYVRFLSKRSGQK